jgi:F420H(2)-dependent quinone reductase
VPDLFDKPPRLPPRWFIRIVWKLHRGIYGVTGGRVGLWRPKPGGWGTSRLTTTGRRTGRPRSVMIGYFTDGSNLVTMAMNGWGEAEPAWWLNLQADPAATVVTPDGQLPVRARAALGEERDRLWARWREVNEKLDGFDARRPGETAVVVLEPQRDRPDRPEDP